MAATFTLNWTPNINSKVIAQRAYYRQKSLGGTFSDEGFDPPNDLSITANTVSITDLLYNTIYEFQITNICDDATDPVVNNNGTIEAIVFKCEPVSATIGYDNIKVYISSLTEDITKVKFSLYNSSEVLLQVITSTASNNYAEATFNNLDSETIYIVKTQYYTILNNQQIISNCTIDNTRTIQTAEYPACTMPLDLVVTAVNI